MRSGTRVLLAWEADEVNSWNPVLARLLRADGYEVVEVNRLDELRQLDLRSFDVCLPRFRMSCASMARIDELLCAGGIPMLNSRDSRSACENKAVAHARFAMAKLAQPGTIVIDADGNIDEAPGWDGETLIKPLHGARSAGIEILDSPRKALSRARERAEALIVQEMIWPARSWRVIAGRSCGAVDPYWRKPAHEERLHAISTGARIARDPAPAAVNDLAVAMCEAVGGDLLAADILERDGEAWALEINHNFDAHGGDDAALQAFQVEIDQLSIGSSPTGTPSSTSRFAASGI
jgi:glutathione synthase/RimK-type ligase-like ATP-grasp enzyme